MSKLPGWTSLDDDALVCTLRYFTMYEMIRVSLVCRRLRACALNTPSLWWDVQIYNSRESSVALFLEVLLRSTRIAGAPVLLRVTDMSRRRDVVDALLVNAHRIYYLHSHIDLDAPCGNQAVALLLSGQRLQEMRLSCFGHTSLALPRDLQCTLRRLQTSEMRLWALPVLESVEEADVELSNASENALRQVFIRFPRARRLILRTNYLNCATIAMDDDDNMRTAATVPVLFARLAKLDSLHIVSLWPYSPQWDPLLSAPLRSVTVSLAPGASTAARRTLRKAFQRLPGPWTLVVRNADVVDVRIDSGDGRERVWALDLCDFPVPAVIRPLLLDPKSATLLLDGSVACGMVYSALDRREAADFAHIHTLRFVAPFVPPRRSLLLPGVRSVVLEAGPGSPSVTAEDVNLLLAMLPQPDIMKYVLEIRGLRITGNLTRVFLNLDLLRTQDENND